WSRLAKRWSIKPHRPARDSTPDGSDHQLSPLPFDVPMKDTYIASLLIITLALATVPNVTRAQPPTADAHEGPQPVQLELDAEIIVTRAGGLENHLRPELGPVSEVHAAELVGPGSDGPVVRIRIGRQSKDVELYTSELNFELVEGDKVAQ